MENSVRRSALSGCASSLQVIIISAACWGNLVLAQPSQTTPDKSAGVKRWTEETFAKGKIPPFSFYYGGIKSDSFIKDWNYTSKELKSSDPSVNESVYIYTDSNTGLTVKCFVSCFNDFPAVEWVIKFSNSSGQNTPVIEKSAAIDCPFKTDSHGDVILHHSRGSNAERSDFQNIDESMSVGKNIYLTPTGGRSSDNTALPFFNIETPGGKGIVAAVGWTGKWYADITRSNEQTVRLKSGMEKMRTVLYPKEEIRTPKICLLFWEGEDRMVGHNQFRQFILAHHSRKINGKFAEYPLSGSFDYGDPAPCNEYNCLTEDYAIALVKRYKMFNVLPELFWLDAGWYQGCGWNKENGDWWQNVGNWTPDRERFPRGLKPVADEVHATGAKFMVWFEPERVRPGTMIDREHPEWLLKLPGNDNYLFNLGNRDALTWLTNYIIDFLRKENIDFYRQDFNFNPMPYWEANDKPDRIGISELRHIEGLYSFWDSLLVRFPNLLIDNCASGGRRIDLETTSRSAPFWRTDYQYGEPNGYQCHTFGLSFYLPIHGTAIYKTDSYTFRSGLGGTAVMNWEVTGRTSESIPSVQKRISDYKELRPYFYGDYYPLTESRNNTSDYVWLAYQLNRPDKKDGLVIAFRRSSSETDLIRVRLHGLEKEAIYELFFEDYGITIEKKGSELMERVDLAIPQKPGSLVIKYKMGKTLK
jgi:alpha-galactosidase